MSRYGFMFRTPAILSIFLLALHSPSSTQVNQGFDLKINILPELASSFKNRPLHISIQSFDRSIDTTLTNVYEVHFEKIPSSRSWVEIDGTITCLDSVSKKYYFIVDEISSSERGMMHKAIVFPRDCPGNKYIAGKICPICKKSDKVIPMYYGEPSFDSGEPGVDVEPGGMITSCSPSWHCKRDNKDF